MSYYVEGEPRQNVTFRVSADEAARLDFIALVLDMSRSKALRFLINEASAALETQQGKGGAE